MKDEFKTFVRTKPELAGYVESGEMSWQKFYELFDLYGADNAVWSKYSSSRGTISKISDLVKGVNVDSIKDNINTAEKLVDFVSDLTSKKVDSPSASSNPVSPRPINKFFED